MFWGFSGIGLRVGVKDRQCDPVGVRGLDTVAFSGPSARPGVQDPRPQTHNPVPLSGTIRTPKRRGAPTCGATGGTWPRRETSRPLSHPMSMTPGFLQDLCRAPTIVPTPVSRVDTHGPKGTTCADVTKDFYSNKTSPRSRSKSRLASPSISGKGLWGTGAVRVGGVASDVYEENSYPTPARSAGTLHGTRASGRPYTP